MTHLPARIGLEPDVRDVLLQQMRDENTALHAENGQLRAENERLRSEGSAKDADSPFGKSWGGQSLAIGMSKAMEHEADHGQGDHGFRDLR